MKQSAPANDEQAEEYLNKNTKEQMKADQGAAREPANRSAYRRGSSPCARRPSGGSPWRAPDAPRGARRNAPWGAPSARSARASRPCAGGSSRSRSDSSPKCSPGPSSASSAPSAPSTRTRPLSTTKSPLDGVSFSKTRAPAGHTRLTESPTIWSSVGSSQAPNVGTPLSALTSVCVCVARVRGAGVAPSSIMLGP